MSDKIPMSILTDAVYSHSEPSSAETVAYPAVLTLRDIYHTPKTGKVFLLGNFVATVTNKTVRAIIMVDDVTVLNIPYTTNADERKPMTVFYVATVDANVQHKFTLAVTSQESAQTVTIPAYNARQLAVIDV